MRCRDTLAYVRDKCEMRWGGEGEVTHGYVLTVDVWNRHLNTIRFGRYKNTGNIEDVIDKRKAILFVRTGTVDDERTIEVVHDCQQFLTH